MDRRLDYLVRELLVGITLNQPPLAGSKNWARRPNCTTTRQPLNFTFAPPRVVMNQSPLMFRNEELVR